MLAHALDQAAGPGGLAMSLAAAAKLALAAARGERIVLPIARFAGGALRPERGWSAPSGPLPAELATTITWARWRGSCKTSWRPIDAGAPLGEIARSIGEVHRARPHQDRELPFASEDYPGILRSVADFLDEERRGLRELIIAIIKGRKQ